MSQTPHSDIIGRAISRTPMTARSALMQVGVQATLVGLEPRQDSLSRRFVGEEGYLCTNRATLQDKASLYGGRQRSNFTVQARRYKCCDLALPCRGDPFLLHPWYLGWKGWIESSSRRRNSKRARGFLGERHPTAKTLLTTRRKTGTLTPHQLLRC